ncbi:MAG: hypothetical protein QXY27_04890 [Nitrososphaerota archaeon]
MRLRRAAMLIMMLAILVAMAQAALCQEPGESFETAPAIKLVTGEITLPESGYYILNSSRSQHIYRLDGLQGGYRLTIILEFAGIEQGRAAISLHKESGEIIAQRRIQYGMGTSQEMSIAYQPSIESAPPGSAHYLALSWYSGSMKYRIRLSLESMEDYGLGKGDAGSSPESAMQLPELSPGKILELKGYLASLDDGGDMADRVDYYLMGARFNSSKSILRISIKPLSDMRVSASLYMDDHRVAYGSSREPGGEVSLEVPGEWKLDERYSFTIRVDNLADKNGGAYVIRAWIEEQNAAEHQATMVKPPGGLDERVLTMIVMAGAASLIAISVLMIFLRRRRIYRVEEVGWWGY